MTPERWQAIERLYHQALERSPGERDGFLAGACGADDSLRAEVTSLIAHGLSAPEVLDAPPAHKLRAAIATRLHERLPVPGRHIGRTLGPYTLQALLAAGGMGEVYRAVDTRLNRTVAVKILLHDPKPQDVTREAEIVSSLNHPHICTIHDIGSEDGVDYLVMEYLEGETLQQRLARGALPLARALEYAVQIVDALDKAHRRGIVHRDIKPANVMLTAAGVKLLDFGIATRHADGARRPVATPWVFATPPYGSPEQLAGQAVDARTDIFSFGAMAYEMITGRRAFPGDTADQVVASVMRDDAPPISDLVPAVPEPLARTLARCLAKDPDERWQTANDLLFELRSLGTARQLDRAAFDRPRGIPRWAERVVWGAALAAALILYAVAARDGVGGTPPPSADLRFALRPEPGTAFASSFDVPFAVSPDGRRLVYVAIGRDSVKRLWLRRLDATTDAAFEIAGTEDANTPFWSPDSGWIGFFSRTRLLKVRVADQRILVIAPRASTMAGASWSSDGVILFPGGPSGLSRVSADGGPVTAATAEEGSHFWPQFVGDGSHFLFAAALPGEIRIGSLDGAPSRALMSLRDNPSSIGYARGFVFFGRDSRLFARAFDEATLQLTGDPIELVKDVPITQLGRMPFSVSAAGPLAVWPYAGGSPATLQWLVEGAAAETVEATPARYVGLTLSPDATRVAVSRRNADNLADVWIRNLAASTETRVTFDGLGFAPRWSADGRRIAYTVTAKPPPKVFVKSLNPPGGDVQLGGSALPSFVSSWCRDGARLVTLRIDPVTRDDLYVDHLDGGRTERLSINTAANEYQGVVSPDDHWLAYVTDVSGRDEVWVASFPSGAVRRQVSVEGGTSPQWTDGGRELAYVSDRKWLTVRAFSGTDGDVTLGAVREMFDASGFVETTPLVTPTTNAYVAAASGRRFLAAVRATDPGVPPIQLIVDWPALVNRR